ncbi:MAG: recombinase family protein [Firmicutes bacterium]|nr:recombinase family protein [Bacillota bacterium]
MKIFIYSRKSLHTDRGESLKNQIKMCREYVFTRICPKDKAEISIYSDEGFSAKSTDRPGFENMLWDIREQRPDFVVCYRLDRISRNVYDFSGLIDELGKLGTGFVCIREEFDTSRPMGKAMMYMASVFAQLERETLAERVRDNMMMLAEKGFRLGGTPPTGYRSQKLYEFTSDMKKKYICCLKEYPPELNAVSIIYESFLVSRSISKTSNILKEKNITNREGKPFSLPGIKAILQNPVYCTGDKDSAKYFSSLGAGVFIGPEDLKKGLGLTAYNRREHRKNPSSRQPESEWIIAPGYHKGLISGKDWVKVQKILKENIPTGKHPAKLHNDYALLSGRIYCSVCGARLFAKPRFKKEITGCKTNDTEFDYICINKLHKGVLACSSQNICGKQADKLFCEAISEYLPEKIRPALYENFKRRLIYEEKQDMLKKLEALKSSFMQLSIYEKRIIAAPFMKKIIWDGQKLNIYISG